MELPYGEYPELAPPEAACANCAKGRNGRNCCPAAGKVPKCAAWQRLANRTSPSRRNRPGSPSPRLLYQRWFQRSSHPIWQRWRSRSCGCGTSTWAKGSSRSIPSSTGATRRSAPCFPDSRPGRMSWERVCLRICCMSCGRCGCSPPERERNTPSTANG